MGEKRKSERLGYWRQKRSLSWALWNSAVKRVNSDVVCLPTGAWDWARTGLGLQSKLQKHRVQVQSATVQQKYSTAVWQYGRIAAELTSTRY